MTVAYVMKALDDALTDQQIVRDVLSVLRESSLGGIVKIEIDAENAQTISIPEATPIEIVTKAFLKEYRDINFRTGYRVQVALGGIQDQKHGILYAKFCFATLYYNEQGQMITIDFHKEMR